MSTGEMLAYQITGESSAPPVVLLHPIATNSAIWAAQVSVWSSEFRVIAIDLPGHGRSPDPRQPMQMRDYAQSVIAVLDTLNIPRAAFVGLSLGGMVAQAIALDWPARVSALVLAHCGAKTSPEIKDVWQTRLDQFRADGRDMASTIPLTLQRWFTADFIKTSPLTMRMVEGLIRATSAIGYETAVKAIQSLDHLARLGEIRIPTLVLGGAQDMAVTPAVSAALAANIPNARLSMLEGTAHIGNVQQPLQFTEEVGDFLRVSNAAQ